MRRPASCLFAIALCLIVALPAAADLSFLRDPQAAVEKLLDATLEKDQQELVDYAMAFYATKYGYLKPGLEMSLRAAVKQMSEEEYRHAVEKAAMFASSKAARTFLKLGKYGEKALKALIVTAEDAAKDLDAYIKDKAIEFDTRH